MSQNNKVALVTGASSGIGQAVAQKLANDGFAVAVCYSNRAAQAQETVDRIKAAGGKAIAVQGDVTRLASVKGLFDETEKHLGKTNVVVCVSGSMLIKPFVETTEEDYDLGMTVNAKGTFLVFAEAARRIQDGGRIIGISSSLVVVGRAGIGLYVAGKAAIEQFVKILAKELGARQITVNAVAPGPTDTEGLSANGRKSAPLITPLGRVAQPSEIASVVAFLSSPEGGWVNGQIVGANGGIV